ncbi:transporter [Treponema primitia ZAS-2]|uniref:Transporter n=1 Tax=Treponema primitia (strain ATCC BAA-887 / DSM 12427 / ZAS-2) TaxID=545694 RepID=F5YHM0_TREPZ|nr:DMT family transporter [Treponema primitia]AEF86881.1 transporter [Treponema primitia ZAS-2]
MNKRALRADILLLLTSCIWGFAFVAQRTGMEYFGPFTYNGVRFLLGSLSLLPLIFFLRRKPPRDGETKPPVSAKRLVLSSLAAGLCLFIAASMQQVGIIYTSAGHSGFITGLYVVLVPIFGIFLGRKTGIPTWVGAVFTLTGLYFLSAAGNITNINPGDIITAVSALFWALHVLVIDALVQKIDPLMLSSGQFACCGILSCAVALFLKEQLSLDAIIAGIIPLLYGGLASVGVAYTLQVVAQKDAPPAHASIILCLEGVFAAIGGVLLLAEPLGSWTLVGFVLMFCGMLATQWDVIFKGFTAKKRG